MIALIVAVACGCSSGNVLVAEAGVQQLGQFFGSELELHGLQSVISLQNGHVIDSAGIVTVEHDVRVVTVLNRILAVSSNEVIQSSLDIGIPVVALHIFLAVIFGVILNQSHCVVQNGDGICLGSLHALVGGNGNALEQTQIGGLVDKVLRPCTGGSGITGSSHRKGNQFCEGNVLTRLELAVAIALGNALSRSIVDICHCIFVAGQIGELAVSQTQTVFAHQLHDQLADLSTSQLRASVSRIYFDTCFCKCRHGLVEVHLARAGGSCKCSARHQHCDAQDNSENF